MDCLQITDIRAYGYTGALPEEQRLGQWFAVDLTLWLDLSIAGASDNLTDTYDYAATITAIQTLIQTSHCQLIERLATQIADRLLATPHHPPLRQVQVRLTKLTPPVPGFSGQVTVEITRSGTAS